jgi:hypothetical protein
MVIDPIQLLRQLEPAVRPASAPSSGRVGQAPLEQRSFDDLLSLVSRGAVRSGRPITIAASALLRGELDDDQRARLASAADTAQAAGARRAVMLIDGRGLVLDVAGRVIESELGANERRALSGIDAAVYVAARDEEIGAATAAPLPGAGVRPPTVARHLEGSGEAAPARETRQDALTRAARPRRRAG